MHIVPDGCPIPHNRYCQTGSHTTQEHRDYTLRPAVRLPWPVGVSATDDLCRDAVRRRKHLRVGLPCEARHAVCGDWSCGVKLGCTTVRGVTVYGLSLIHISEPTRRTPI